ncbi:hypothetical protein ACFSTC_63235 [Nonomuraea ferruginea]
MTRKERDKGGYSEEAGYMAGRDDEYAVTAGSDEKAVAARTDEIEGHEEVVAGPSPHPMPPGARGDQGHGGDPGFRVRGPVDEAREGEVEDDGENLAERVSHWRPPERRHRMGRLRPRRGPGRRLRPHRRG